MRPIRNGQAPRARQASPAKDIMDYRKYFYKLKNKCVYCNSQCMDTGSFWKCNKCSEQYIFNDYWGKSITFTCKEFYINHYMEDEKLFSVKNREKPLSDWVAIPAFNIDFTDKDKLYKKIKTYLLMS